MESDIERLKVLIEDNTINHPRIVNNARLQSTMSPFAWEKLLGTWLPIISDNIQQRIAYVIFCCQNPIAQVSSLLLGMKSGFYHHTRSASGSILKIYQNGNQRPASEKSYAVSLVGFRRYYLL